MAPLDRVTWLTSPRQRYLAGGLAVLAVILILPLLAPGAAPEGVLFQGIELGAVNGMLALGLVLTYRANRVINFSYGAMGGVAGTAGAMLYLGQHWNWFLCLAVAVVIGGLVGVGVDWLLRWRFSKAPRLIVMVATIGLAQLLGGLQVLIPGWLHGPAFQGGFTTPLSSFHFTLRPVLFDGNDLVILGVLLVVPASLSWFLLRTQLGVAVRSLADNPDRAQLLGIPLRRLSTLVWLIAGGLAALTVMVNAPSQGVTQSVLAGPTLLLPALAAAVVARMESLPVAFGAGVGLGLVNALINFNVRQVAVTDVVLLGVILLALALQRFGSRQVQLTETWSSTGMPKKIPAALRRLPEVRVTKWVLCLAVAAVACAVPYLAGPGGTLEYTVALVFGLAALSLVVLSGWSGSVSLGQFAFAGIGGVVAGDLIEKANVDLIQALLAAAAVGAVAALVVGLPALKARGDFLAVTTLALAVCVSTYFLNPANFPRAIPQDIVRPFFLQRIDLTNNRALYYFCLVLLAIAVFLVHGLRRARTGRVLLATRDNFEAAEAMAVPTVRARLAAFMLAGALAGVAGALYIVTLRAVEQATFDPSLSLLVFSMAVIGGMGSITGTLLGVALIQIATYSLPQYQQLIAGAGLLLVLVVLPGGLAQGLERVRDLMLRRVAQRRGLATLPLGPFETVAGPADRLEAPVTVGTTDHEVLLRCRAIEASYGSVQILFGVDLSVRSGEIVALLGTNGAGKSTLLRCVSGLLGLGEGRIDFDGQRIDGLSANEIARRGVALVPGGRGVFPNLTVRENLDLGAWLTRKDAVRVAAASARLLALFPALGHRLTQRAGNLSGGEQQMLSLAMALMITPRLLLIDELSLGLAPSVVAELLNVVRDLNADGITVVVVEQSVNVALTLAERAVFMEKGEVRFSGPTAELLERPDILRSVFIAGDHGRASGSSPLAAVAPATVANGHAGNGTTPPSSALDAPAALECRKVSKRFGGIQAIDGVDLTLRRGQILGLVGHNGAGKTTLFNLISGFLEPDAGHIVMGELNIDLLPPYRRAEAGLGRSFQEARLYPSLTVAETIAVAQERHLTSRHMVAAALRLPASLDAEVAAWARADELVELLGLGPFVEKLIGELSTGTRRIVELACVLAQEPTVMLFDEPSAGVAQRETEALGSLLLKVRQETACAILVIEHDMPLLASISDEMVALELGTVIARGTPAEILAHPRVIESYLGVDQATIERSGVLTGPDHRG